jgi:phosphoserine aminotransferase
MKSTPRKYNLTAGPSYLPEAVLDELVENLYSYKETGVGVAEMSHRGADYEFVNAEAETLVRELLNVGDSHAVIFTTGGATNQFSMVPMNLLKPETTGNYINSGIWADAAIEEGRKFGSLHVAASSKDEGWRSIPKTMKLSANPAYLHYTSNNTVVGSQFRTEPAVPAGVPLICDASSDIFSRPIDVSKYDVIYAGTQKNMGIAGATMVIIRTSLLERCDDKLPVMMNYVNHIKARSMYNTPPTFPIFATTVLLNWVKEQGGVIEMEKRANERANIVYEALDSNPAFAPYIAVKEDRSLMNITFHVTDNVKEEKFKQLAQNEGLIGMNGHRQIGGFRASMYNAFPIAGAKKLAEVIGQIT